MSRPSNTIAMPRLFEKRRNQALYRVFRLEEILGDEYWQARMQLSTLFRTKIRYSSVYSKNLRACSCKFETLSWFFKRTSRYRANGSASADVWFFLRDMCKDGKVFSEWYHGENNCKFIRLPMMSWLSTNFVVHVLLRCVSLHSWGKPCWEYAVSYSFLSPRYRQAKGAIS